MCDVVTAQNQLSAIEGRREAMPKAKSKRERSVSDNREVEPFKHEEANSNFLEQQTEGVPLSKQERRVKILDLYTELFLPQTESKGNLCNHGVEKTRRLADSDTSKQRTLDDTHLTKQERKDKILELQIIDKLTAIKEEKDIQASHGAKTKKLTNRSSNLSQQSTSQDEKTQGQRSNVPVSVQRISKQSIKRAIAALSAQGEVSMNLLNIVIQTENIALLHNLLRMKMSNPKMKDGSGTPPLNIAVCCFKNKEMNLKAMDLLIEYGADVDASDEDGNTPLHCASSRGIECATEKLLSCRADHSKRNKKGYTALHTAFGCIKSQRTLEAVVKHFLEHGVDVNQADEEGYSPLHMACSLNLVKIVTSLLESRAFLDATN
ncbi:hypothetical protein CAPTEDRAFT_204541, partial [Capitella teleta]